MVHQRIAVEENFYEDANIMRDVFDSRFAAPLKAEEHRFQWDYWHVPEQYTLVRTPAYNFFSENDFSKFEEALKVWGQKNLGCSDISPAWLSYYVEGCEQNLHADNPHGPWAFVFSLTPWEQREFSGGETLLLTDKTLNYWDGFTADLGLERESFIQEIPAKFNQLTVFDPRIPHGVKTVRGVKDPRKARLVIHGWFLEPAPQLTGALNGEDLSEELGQVLNPALDEVESMGEFQGYICFRLTILDNGSLNGGPDLMVNTLKSKSGASHLADKTATILRTALTRVEFPKSSGESELVLPLVFK